MHVQVHELPGGAGPELGVALLGDSRRSTCHRKVFHAHSPILTAFSAPA
ncbi:MAG: hypothetical protein M3460_15845 [Actinomycetota bacterium]|nr:hypothetical protein [Actinomycetota bacterium]